MLMAQTLNSNCLHFSSEQGLSPAVHQTGHPPVPPTNPANSPVPQPQNEIQRIGSSQRLALRGNRRLRTYIFWWFDVIGFLSRYEGCSPIKSPKFNLTAPLAGIASVFRPGCRSIRGTRVDFSRNGFDDGS